MTNAQDDGAPRGHQERDTAERENFSLEITKSSLAGEKTLSLGFAYVWVVKAGAHVCISSAAQPPAGQGKGVTASGWVAE